MTKNNINTVMKILVEFGLYSGSRPKMKIQIEEGEERGRKDLLKLL